MSNFIAWILAVFIIVTLQDAHHVALGDRRVLLVAAGIVSLAIDLLRILLYMRDPK